ncbi:MAG: hypothetical protein HRS50_01530 [Mycoplasmataceae bacterium]|nr:hypothetical protein [Mycoplasmataceae bacterium]
MDYKNFKKEELLDLLEKKEIFFNRSWSKEKLITTLNKNDNKKIEKEKITNITTLDFGEAGAIVNIVFAAVGIPFWVILSLVFIGIPFLVGAICSIIFNVRFKNGKGNKMTAGVLGLIFSGVIGGVLVLVSQDIVK